MPDERDVIDAVLRAVKSPAKGYSRIGDDVALVRARGRKAVLKVDMLVESTDVPPEMTYRQAARKAVAMCVSDFAAKGVRPDSFMVSLGLKKGTNQEMIDRLGQGFRDAEDEWGVHMVGGDTNEAHELVIDCAMLGFGSRIVERGGANVGDVVVVTGEFGLQRAGLKILTEGANAGERFRKRAVRSVLSPSPDLRVGLAVARLLTSGMDSSDGLARSLHTLARASGVGFELNTLPTGEGVRKFAEDNGLSSEKLVLEGGEEYVIVGTLKSKDLRKAKEAARRAGGRLVSIGKATARGAGVVLRSGGPTRQIRDEGWTHLR